MSHFHHDDNKDGVMYFIKDAITPHANAVEILYSGHFLHPIRTRGLFQSVNALSDSFLNDPGKALKLALGPLGNLNCVQHGKSTIRGSS